MGLILTKQLKLTSQDKELVFYDVPGYDSPLKFHKEQTEKRLEEADIEKANLITSRAVTNTDMLLNLTKEVSSDSTHYLFYKGNRVFDEIEDVKNQLDYDIVQKNQRNYLYIKGRA